MTRPDAIDQSFSTANPAQAAAAGIKLICSYLSNDPSKNWTPAEIRSYHAVGIGCEMNWEGFAAEAKGGATAGAVNATTAVRLADALVAGVGYKSPTKLGIAYSVDFDTTPGDYAVIDAYFRAIRTVHGGRYLVGAYGEADLIDHLFAAGLIDFGWQTYAWSGGRLSNLADLYQYSNNQSLGGAAVDFNRIIDSAALGAWWAPGDTTHSISEQPLEDWFDMATVDDLRSVVRSVVYAVVDERIKALQGGTADRVLWLQTELESGHLQQQIGSIIGGGSYLSNGHNLPGAEAKIIAAVTDAIAAIPAPATGVPAAGLTVADIEQAVRNVLHSA
jgi:hypothetical protein